MYKYHEILQRMFSQIGDDLDTRPSSPIFNALAPAAMEIADLYVERLIFKEQSFLTTAIRENLDALGGNYSLPRKQATKALRLGNTYDLSNNLFDIPLNTRFTVPDTNNRITYILLKYVNLGVGLFQCEQAGIIGNEYFGKLLPLQIVNNLSEVILTSIHTPGTDIEDDETYRQRLKDRVRDKPFSGNISGYKQIMRDIPGIGQVKVFPIWNGGGTVKISALGTDNRPIASTFIDTIKEMIDPVEDTGMGIGIAPIGHQVTITTPNLHLINIQATLTLSNLTIPQVQPMIQTTLQNHFNDVVSMWEILEISVIYVAEITAKIIGIPGVIDVSNVLLNNLPSNIFLQNTPLLQQIPELGIVTLS